MQEISMHERGRRIRRVGLWGIIANIILFAVKAVIGWLGGSMAVVADAFNNLSDGTASVIGLIGAYFSGKPADAEHPYGHGRIEYISAFVVAFLVLQMGFSLFSSSISRLLKPQPLTTNTVMLAIVALSIPVKLWLWRINTREGRRLSSSMMLATGADALNDVWVTLATLVSLLIVHVWQFNIDGWIGLTVSVLVMKNGVMLAIETLQPLIGEPIDPQFYRSIEVFVEAYDEIEGSHDLMIHNYGAGQNIASIHAEVSNSLSIEEAHLLADRIEREIAHQMGLLLVIHIDPMMPETELTRERRAWIETCIAFIDDQITMHDFRMVQGDEGYTYIFDIILPYRYLPQQENEILARLTEEIKVQRPMDECLIKIDRCYTGNSQKKDIM